MACLRNIGHGREHKRHTLLALVSSLSPSTWDSQYAESTCTIRFTRRCLFIWILPLDRRFVFRRMWGQIMWPLTSDMASWARLRTELLQIRHAFGQPVPLLSTPQQQSHLFEDAGDGSWSWPSTYALGEYRSPITQHDIITCSGARTRIVRSALTDRSSLPRLIERTKSFPRYRPYYSSRLMSLINRSRRFSAQPSFIIRSLVTMPRKTKSPDGYFILAQTFDRRLASRACDISCDLKPSVCSSRPPRLLLG